MRFQNMHTRRVDNAQEGRLMVYELKRISAITTRK